MDVYIFYPSWIYSLFRGSLPGGLWNVQVAETRSASRMTPDGVGPFGGVSWRPVFPQFAAGSACFWWFVQEHTVSMRIAIDPKLFLGSAYQRF